ncbi:MAG: carboxypeptidase-like regulatory domain-containing protein [Euryarchaeota archaeon]|nr:carboxypeptidase-like regulatory domain-containing protein [Euryarchaeota archaeon]
MRRFLGPPCLLAVALLALSGCVGDSPATSAPTSSAPVAAEPTVEADVGSITGLVLSDEELPLPGARVALLSTKNATETDASGRFTFNGVQPGAHPVLVEALGYASTSRKVDVRGGEVTEVKFVLQPISFAEPYVDTRRATAYIFAGESFVDIGTHEVTEELCKPCHFWMLNDGNVTAAMLETDWKAPVTVAPVLNDDIFVLLCKNLENTTTKYRCDGPSAYMKNRARLSVDAGFFKGVLKTRLDVHAGLSIAYDFRVDVWRSLAFVETFPDGYTALPPPR